MLRVGLTGSIAVGKSFVLGVFKELGCHVLDADKTAREVVAPGMPGLREVSEAFGGEIIKSDGSLDREKLGAIVFNEESQRLRLNSILHPYIIAEQDRQLNKFEVEDPQGIAIVDAALMIESGGYKRFDKLIVVHCRHDLQIERLMARDSISLEEARRRIAAQMPQEEKMRYADFLIDTSDGFESAKSRAIEVFEELKKLQR